MANKWAEADEIKLLTKWLHMRTQKQGLFLRKAFHPSKIKLKLHLNVLMTNLWWNRARVRPHRVLWSHRRCQGNKERDDVIDLASGFCSFWTEGVCYIWVRYIVKRVRDEDEDGNVVMSNNSSVSKCIMCVLVCCSCLSLWFVWALHELLHALNSAREQRRNNNEWSDETVKKQNSGLRHEEPRS